MRRSDLEGLREPWATARVGRVPFGAQEAFTEAKASALRALAMDSGSADAQVALGTVLFLSEWDWTAAERSLQRALEINPDHTEALLQYGSLQEALGRLDDGLRCKQQALARDPRSPGVLVQIAISYWHQRKYDDTLVWARRALEVDPKHVLASQFIMHVYVKIGDINRFAAWTVSQALAWGFPEERVAAMKQVIADMQQVYTTAGLSGVRRFLVDQITNPQLDFDILLKMAFFRAVLYGAAGRLDEAFDCLDQAIADRDPALVHLAVGPDWDGLRADQRFNERLKRMALPSVCECCLRRSEASCGLAYQPDSIRRECISVGSALFLSWVATRKNPTASTTTLPRQR